MMERISWSIASDISNVRLNDKFDENSDDKYIRELKSIVERNGNLWSGEAERYFIQNAPEI